MIDLVEAVVVHITLGVGIVKECDDTGLIKVAFKSRQLMLKYPESFKDGLIYFDDPYIKAKMEIDFGQRSVVSGKRIWNFPRRHLVAAYFRDPVEKQSKLAKSADCNPLKEEKHTSRVGWKRHNRPKIITSHAEYVYNPYDWDEKLVRSCETCFLYKSGDCNGVRNAKTCDEYKAIPNITKAEQYLWPKKR